MTLAEVHEAIDWSRPYESLDNELQRLTRDAPVEDRTGRKPPH